MWNSILEVSCLIIIDNYDILSENLLSRHYISNLRDCVKVYYIYT